MPTVLSDNTSYESCVINLLMNSAVIAVAMSDDDRSGVTVTLDNVLNRCT